MKTLPTKAFASLMALMLVLSACKSPGTGGGAATATEQPAPPPPTGFTDIIDAKVASGEWTLGQGIVEMLKVFAGETPAAAAGLSGGVQEGEGSGVLAMAGDYLQNGDDPAAKAEITRLVDKLLPTRETLDAYTIPASTGKGGSILAAPAPNTAPVTAEECAALWTGGFPDTRTPSFQCFKGGEVTVGGNSYKVYFPLAWDGDASKQGFYDATLQAAQDSVPVFSPNGTLKSIYFVFTTLSDADDPLNTLAATYWDNFHPAEEACPVLVFPKAFGLSIKDFKQTMAHEIFHCFQAWNFPTQSKGAGYASAKWWEEGTAEYFSNTVYPANDYEQRWKGSFATLSAAKPLTAMTYENFAFFQFIANMEGGPTGVLALMHSLPVTPGISLQVDTLAAYPGINDLFEQFARQVFDGQLIDTSGTAIDFPGAYSGTVNINGGTSSVMVGETFVLARFNLLYAPKHRYTNSFTTSGADGHDSARRSGVPGTWGDLPAEVQSGCGPASYVVYVLTTVPNASRAYSLTVAEAGDAPCDQCLVGTWEATNDSYLAYMESVLSKSGAVAVTMVSGKMWMEFNDNGLGGGGYDPLTVYYSMATADMTGGTLQMDFELTFKGQSEGPYTADGSNLVFSGGSGDFAVTINATINGSPIDVGDTNNIPADAVSSASYTCKGNTLTYYPPISGASPIILLRTSP